MADWCPCHDPDASSDSGGVMAETINQATQPKEMTAEIYFKWLCGGYDYDEADLQIAKKFFDAGIAWASMLVPRI